MTVKSLADTFPGGENVDRVTDHESDWFFAEGIPGTGVRPDYLEQKYKSVADQAKAYKEAQKLIGSNIAAPESYDFTDVKDDIDQENPHIQLLITHAKEARLQQDQFSKLVKTFVDYDKSKLPHIDEKEEIAKAGGQQKVTTVQNWIKNNLSATAVKALEKLPVKAEVVEMLEELRQKMISTQSKLPIVDDIIDAKDLLTVQKIQKEMEDNYALFITDKDYRKEINTKFKQVLGEE